MKSNQGYRESQRIRELADNYINKGYSVVYPRTQLDLPEFLRGQGYIPDLLAMSESESLVIEVKTSETVRRDSVVSRVSELVNRQAGWQFVFVLTNRKTDVPAMVAPNSARWHELLAKSRHPALANPELSEAAYLLAWAALEGVIREATTDEARTQGKSAAAKAPMSLVRDAAILGLIDRNDLAKLEPMFHLRNSIVHSIGGPSPTPDDVRELQRLVDEVARIAHSNDGI